MLFGEDRTLIKELEKISDQSGEYNIIVYLLVGEVCFSLLVDMAFGVGYNIVCPEVIGPVAREWDDGPTHLSSYDLEQGPTPRATRPRLGKHLVSLGLLNFDNHVDGRYCGRRQIPA